MVKRIFLIVAACLLGSAFYYVYQRHRAENRYNTGEISSQDLHGNNDAAVGSDDGDGTTASSSRPDGEDSRSKRQPSGTAVVTSTVSRSSTSGAPGAPATDSIAPNPPNGAAFAGTGRYQVYRQGNLTWRVNTDDGKTCILFATDEEWRKPIVYSHGCRTS